MQYTHNRGSDRIGLKAEQYDPNAQKASADLAHRYLGQAEQLVGATQEFFAFLGKRRR